MSKPKVLVQLDSDAQASVFDSIVAVDAGVDQLLRHQSVEPTQVRDLVYGAMFTRGPEDLRHTAIFIGGSDVAGGEALLEQVTGTFFGSVRVSVMMDANGANTTAAAAVLAASRHADLKGATVLVLAGTGPVGQRAVWLLAREGATVRVGSRRADRSAAVCQAVEAKVDGATLAPCQTSSPNEMLSAVEGSQIVIAAGAAGVQLLPVATRQRCRDLRVAIDLNAVPPVGIAGIELGDKGVERDGVICYGAIGVGATKMKIHKMAVRKLFEANDQVFDAEEIFAIARQLEP